MLPGEGRNVPAPLGRQGRLRGSERFAAFAHGHGETVADAGEDAGSPFPLSVIAAKTRTPVSCPGAAMPSQL